MKTKYWILIIIVVMLFPLGLYYIISLPWGFTAIGGGNASIVWLGFWGAYAGAIITSLVTFYVLKKQLAQNQSVNLKNREQQINVLRYTDMKKELELVGTYMADFQMSFNLPIIYSVVNRLVSGIFTREDADRISNLSRDLMDKAFRINLPGYVFTATAELKNYQEISTKIKKEYGLLLSDLSFFIDFIINLPEDNSDIDRYVRHHIDQEKIIMSTLPYWEKDYVTIMQIVESVGDFQNIKANSRKIVKDRYLMIVGSIAATNENLKSAIVELINVERNKINEILKSQSKI